MAKHPKRKKIIILTGSELRHDFFRKYLASSDEIEVLASYCEGAEKSLASLTKGEPDNELRMAHLHIREQLFERVVDGPNKRHVSVQIGSQVAD